MKLENFAGSLSEAGINPRILMDLINKTISDIDAAIQKNSMLLAEAMDGEPHTKISAVLSLAGSTMHAPAATFSKIMAVIFKLTPEDARYLASETAIAQIRLARGDGAGAVLPELEARLKARGLDKYLANLGFARGP